MEGNYNLASPDRTLTNTLGLLLNADWFQLYKQVQVAYSVDVIYAVIVNLPRLMRYKDNNFTIIYIYV